MRDKRFGSKVRQLTGVKKGSRIVMHYPPVANDASEVRKVQEFLLPRGQIYARDAELNKLYGSVAKNPNVLWVLRKEPAGILIAFWEDEYLGRWLLFRAKETFPLAKSTKDIIKGIKKKPKEQYLESSAPLLEKIARAEKKLQRPLNDMELRTMHRRREYR